MNTSIKTIADSVMSIAKANPMGFTVGLDMNPINSGYAVATQTTQNSFGEKGCATAVAVAFFQDTETFQGVGGWLNNDDGQYYFDAIRIFEHESDAVEYGIANKQYAIFNLNTKTEIKLQA